MRTYIVRYYNPWTGWQDIQMMADGLSNLRRNIIKEGLALSKPNAPQRVVVRIKTNGFVKRLGHIECVNPWTGEYVWVSDTMRRKIVNSSGELKRRK